MSTHRLFHAVAPVCVVLLAAGITSPSQLSTSARAQGFYFESWRGGFGGPGGVSIGIGVPPSSPLFYGVRPSQIYPPLGFHSPYGIAGSHAGIAGSHVPFGYRDYRADYYNRLYQQYHAQLGAGHPYGVDPLHQSNVYRYLRGLTVPPLDAAPPVIAIQPFAELGYGGHAAQRPDALGVPAADLRGMLHNAAQRLARALARRGEEGVIWRDYLGPEKIIEAIAQGSDARQLGTLLLNYDGVIANGQLRWVMRLDGFVETRQLLRQYLQAAADTRPAQQERPAPRDPATPPPPPAPPQAEAADGRDAGEALPAPTGIPL